MAHIDPNLLLMVLEGQLPPRTLLQSIYGHLKELCPECRTSLELVAEEAGWSLEEADEAGDGLAEVHALADSPQGAGTVPDLCLPVIEEIPSDAGAVDPRYAEAFRRAERRVFAHAASIDDEQRRARRELSELEGLSRDERRERILGLDEHYPRRALAELLLEESREAVRRDPATAHDLADLVPTLLDRPSSSPQPWREELTARALAHRGNALRVAGRLRDADATFWELRTFLADHALDLEDLGAEVASLEASLRTDQGRYGDAVQLLGRAEALYRSSGELAGLARVLVQRGQAQHLDQDLEAAHESLTKALNLIDPEEDRHLYLCAVGNCCQYLCAAERHREAGELLERHAAMIGEHSEPWFDHRVSFLRGLIASGLGNLEEAEALFLRTRDELAAQGQAVDAALLTLELSLLYQRQGRTAELRDAARWIVSVFEAEAMSREAHTALILFERAVVAERVSEKIILGLRSALESTRSESPQRPS